MITKELLKELFKYQDGDLIRIKNVGKRGKIGDIAGCLHREGYLITVINRVIHYNHRLIFLYHYGYLPDCLDHIDNNPLNNRIENLRECSLTGNSYNRRISVRNTSGVKGIVWNKKSNKWQAQININGKPTYLGLFDSIDKAELIVREAREKHHGEFANHG